MSEYDIALSKISNPNQLLFLENYPKFKSVKLTALAVGISENLPYDWKYRKDKAFTDAYELLKKRIKEELIAAHEQNIDNLAFDEKTKDQSRIFASLVRLRAEAPDKYREKPVEHKFTGEILIKTNIPRPQIEAPDSGSTTKEIEASDSGSTMKEEGGIGL